MIPQHRLAHLLDHVKHTQINNCLYHNTAEPPSLYSDHMCDRNDFPLEVSARLSHHSDEVWYCEFSHDGTKLVTAGKDHHVLIYDTSDFSVLKRLTDHEEGVAFASWSPDDSKLITCSQDKKARVWSVEVRFLFEIDHEVSEDILTGRFRLAFVCLLSITTANQSRRPPGLQMGNLL
jgi:WD40 repeat protein